MEITCRSAFDRSYSIHFDWGLLKRTGSFLRKEQLKGPFFIVSDQKVFRIHGKSLLESLKGFRTACFLVKPGESSKSVSNWRKIQDFLAQQRADRRSAVIAFGGGVIGDLAGFAASTFMRGLDLIQVPTTLLSQSDSSIGSKVAVNHPKAKNLIGSFHQPRLVLTDPSVLSTLSRREFSAGLGEAIKYGVISDPELFGILHRDVEKILSYNKELLSDLISRCIRMKVGIVEEDERETGLRRILNFGHTIGHALEQATKYRVLRHGEAVAWGMLAAGWLAIHRRMWKTQEFDRLQSIIERAGCLYPFGNLTPRDIIHAIQHDKKKVGKVIHFILPERTGKVTIVRDIREEEMLGAVHFIVHLNRTKISEKKRGRETKDGH